MDFFFFIYLNKKIIKCCIFWVKFDIIGVEWIRNIRREFWKSFVCECSLIVEFLGIGEGSIVLYECVDSKYFFSYI